MNEKWKRCLRWARLSVLAALTVTALTAAAAADEASVEAESGVLLGGAHVITAGDDCFVEGLNTDGDGVTVTIVAPETGFYNIVVRSASMGGHKENLVAVDGQNVGVIVNDDRAYTEPFVEYVYLEQGPHEVTITKSWGWIKIDRVSLVKAEALPEDLYEVEPVLVNPNADDNARRLMAFLCDIYGKKILSGQFCDEGPFGTENACIWRATGGKYPAVLGLDLIDYSPSRVSHGASSKAVDYAIDYWDQGGIVTFCWHWNAPDKYVTGKWYSAFYKEHTNINLDRIMSGQDPEGYALLMSDIDAIALQLKRLQDAGVPVLWRPLHEASGGWFWWGNCKAESYKALYIAMYEKLTNEHGLNNLIWVWNGQAADWYPGDEYVDIIGEDIYPGEHVYTTQASRFLQATRYTSARKMVVLSENGCLFDPELAVRDNIMWGFFCTWQGEFVAKAKGYNMISEQYTEKSMVQKVYKSDVVIDRKELPDLKNYPLPGEGAAGN